MPFPNKRTKGLWQFGLVGLETFVKLIKIKINLPSGAHNIKSVSSHHHHLISKRFQQRNNLETKMLPIVGKILDNTLTRLSFNGADEDAIDNVKDIIDALKKNSSIVTVEFLGDFLGCVRNDARSELLRALFNIKCLQEVRLEDGLVMIADIAGLISEAKGLKVLTVTRIVLQGVQADFDATEVALHQHNSLKEFTMTDCQPALADLSMDNLRLPVRDGAGVAAGSITSDASPISASARSA